MDKILNKNKLIDSLKFDRVMDEETSIVVERFYANDALEKFPFEIVDMIKPKGAEYRALLGKDYLWKLNTMDLEVAKHLISNYKAKSISNLISLYKNPDLLNEVCKSDSTYIDELLDMSLNTRYYKENYYKRVPDEIINEYGTLLVLQVVDFIMNSDSKECYREKLGSFLDNNKLDLVESYFNEVRDIWYSSGSYNEYSEALSDIHVRATDILTSKLFEKLSQSFSNASSECNTLWRVWLKNGISRDVLNLMNTIADNCNHPLCFSDINIFMSIINSECRLGTKFKYDELKELYKEDIYELFRNLTGGNNMMIMQKEINALLREKANVANPYDCIYGDNARESKFLKCIDSLNSNSAGKLKELLNAKKINFLESLYEYCKDLYEDEADDSKILKHMFSTNIMECYDYLDRLLHLNNLNKAQVKILNRTSDYTIRRLCDLLDDETLTRTLNLDIASRYGLDNDIKLYSGEKFNFEEYSLLVSNLQENLVFIMLLLKKLKVKNSRIINICKEISKSNLYTKLSRNELCKLIDISINYNSLYLYSEKANIFSTKIKNIDNLIYYIIHENDLMKLNISKESELEFMRKRKVTPSYFVNRNITDISAIQRELCLTDREMKSVLEMLNVSDAFVAKNFENILSFYANGLGTVAATLKDRLVGRAKNNLPLIVKAELAGALKDIKYLPEDYKKEIGMPVTDEQRYLWENNTKLNNVCEADDFETIIRIGQYPTKTCQHWESGGYVRSILSNFDTNKKIIVHKTPSGRIDARAILRLTKMTSDNATYKGYLNGDNEYYDDFGFKDVTEGDLPVKEVKTTVPKEELVLFLERCYTSLDTEQAIKVKEEIIELAKAKASEMGVKLVVSNSYDSVFGKNSELRAKYCYEDHYIYISKSKNGYQYLDSLSGEQSNSDSEKYHPTRVYVSKR